MGLPILRPQRRWAEVDPHTLRLRSPSDRQGSWSAPCAGAIMSAGTPRMPRPAELKRRRVALALCLAVERDDVDGFEVLRSSLPPEGLTQGFVSAVRSLAYAVCHSSGEEPGHLLRRLINDVLAKEAARWW